MAKGWYIINTEPGYEFKVKGKLRSLITRGDLSSDIVLDVKVPLEDVIEIKDGRKKISSKKLFPDYVMVLLDLPDLMWKDTCTIILKIYGVIGFLGTTPNERPRPISDNKAKSFLYGSCEGKDDITIKNNCSFSVGDQVKVIEGAFASFTGTVEEVNLEKSKLRVTVSIFGRATPVELDFSQVELISSKKVTIKVKANSSKFINKSDSGNCNDGVETRNVATSLNETDTWGNLNARAVVTLSPNVKITESKVTPKGYELSI